MFDLSPEEEKVRDLAKASGEELVRPFARQNDAERIFNRGVLQQLGQAGLVGGPIKKCYGGLELGQRAQVLIYEELGRIDSSVRGFLAVQTGLVASCIQEWADEEKKQLWLKDMCLVEAIGCYCLTEEHAGSDVASMRTRALRDGDDWIINGEKIWITNGNVADVALVFAQADPEQKHKGITAFCIPTTTPGFTPTKMDSPELGHRGADHARIRFEDMRVPDSARIGAVGEGFKIAMAALDCGRLGVASGAVGVHAACLDASVDFARRRRQFGKRLGDQQMIQKTLADMYMTLEAGRCLTMKAATLKDAGKKATREVSAAKLYTTEAAAEAAHAAIMLHGGRGYNNDYPLERYYRDIVGLEIYEGSSNIQRLIIARDLLGKDMGQELEEGK
ncbi:MAG: alkylation response protein AidB-like acyl-CoA dehydrogenase [Planctomycetota bacterium]|jgi:alkylation response protein AidB-like acyl-CoA dehydrogenase